MRTLKHGVIRWGIALALLIIAAHQFLGNDFEEPQVEIATPQNEDEVSKWQAVTGVHRGLQAGDRIAVASYSEAAGTYQFHYDHTQVWLNGEWCTSHVKIGTDTDQGKIVRLIAILMSKSAQEEIRDYLRNPLRRQLSTLPKGAKVLCEITVKRRDQDSSNGAGGQNSNSTCPDTRALVALRTDRWAHALDVADKLSSILAFVLALLIALWPLGKSSLFRLLPPHLRWNEGVGAQQTTPERGP